MDILIIGAGLAGHWLSPAYQFSLPAIDAAPVMTPINLNSNEPVSPSGVYRNFVQKDLGKNL
jgi:hypothetical protein